jgi:uncharacterized membrane protein (UPF0136 family)
MSASERDSYKQMSTVDVRRWLSANSVVAGIFATALFAIATNNFGRGLSSGVIHHVAAIAVSAAFPAVTRSPSEQWFIPSAELRILSYRAEKRWLPL